MRKLLFFSLSDGSPTLDVRCSDPEVLRVGDWRAELHTGRLVRDGEERDVEPKVMDLLFLLGSRPGAVLSREELIGRLWPGVVVGDDALARTVFKLRKVLQDDPKSPRFIETIPKRGYRLIGDAVRPRSERRRPDALVTARRCGMGALALAALFATVDVVPSLGSPSPSASAAMLAHADLYYNQFRRSDNEAAILLFERVLAAEPRNATALAGLSAALVQRVVRWPRANSAPQLGSPALTTALRSGHLDTDEGPRTLKRAQDLAELAVRERPDDPDILRSYGLALSARRRFSPARAAYRRALAQNPDAWAVLINLAELKRLAGDHDGFRRDLEAAYLAIDRSGLDVGLRTWPWKAELGVQVGQAHQAAGRIGEAELWFRRVLEYAPLHPGATRSLACVLSKGGEAARAGAFCRTLNEDHASAVACMPC